MAKIKKEDYQERYISSRKFLDEKEIGFARNEKPEDLIHFFSCISGKFHFIAVGDYVNEGNVEMMKNSYYNGAKTISLALKLFDMEEDYEPGSFQSMRQYQGLLWALVSDSKEAIMELAEIIGGRGKVDRIGIDRFSYYCGYALKHIVLDDYEEALKHVEALEKYKDNSYSAYRVVFRAIIEHDQEMLNEGLLLMVEKHKRNRQYNRMDDKLFSYQTVALAKLAKMKGLEVEIDDPIAPAEVIETHDIGYELRDILKNEFEKLGV